MAQTIAVMRAGGLWPGSVLWSEQVSHVSACPQEPQRQTSKRPCHSHVVWAVKQLEPTALIYSRTACSSLIPFPCFVAHTNHKESKYILALLEYSLYLSSYIFKFKSWHQSTKSRWEPAGLQGHHIIRFPQLKEKFVISSDFLNDKSTVEYLNHNNFSRICRPKKNPKPQMPGYLF